MGSGEQTRKRLPSIEARIQPEHYFMCAVHALLQSQHSSQIRTASAQAQGTFHKISKHTRYVPMEPFLPNTLAHLH